MLGICVGQLAMRCAGVATWFSRCYPVSFLRTVLAKSHLLLVPGVAVTGTPITPRGELVSFVFAQAGESFPGQWMISVEFDMIFTPVTPPTSTGEFR